VELFCELKRRLLKMRQRQIAIAGRLHGRVLYGSIFFSRFGLANRWISRRALRRDGLKDLSGGSLNVPARLGQHCLVPRVKLDVVAVMLAPT
jgi:hypothetical protein